MAWFRRKEKSDRTTGADETPVVEETAPPAPATDDVEAVAGPEHGPWDVTAVKEREGYLELGSLWIPAIEGLMLSFELDQAQSQVTGVQVVRGDSVLQLQAFAAPRSAGIWDDIRSEIAESIRAQGGGCHEEEGPFGAELVVVVNGGSMRFIGVDGPRWFLRGVMSGRAATDLQAGAEMREVFSHIAVDRGDEAMGPRELLPILMPEEAGATEPADEGRSASDLDPFTRGPEITEIR